MKICIKKSIYGWEPFDDAAREYHKKGTLGEVYHTDVKKFRDQRSVEMNALY